MGREIKIECHVGLRLKLRFTHIILDIWMAAIKSLLLINYFIDPKRSVVVTLVTHLAGIFIPLLVFVPTSNICAKITLIPLYKDCSFTLFSAC